MIFIRKLHKWLGLVIFIQLVLWTVSGLMFSWLNHHEVAAERGVHPPVAQPLAHSQLLAEPAAWLDQYADREIREIRLISVLDRWFWRIEAAGQVELRDAAGGTRVTLDEAFVQRMAREYYKGKGQLSAVSYQEKPTLETRGSGAVWRAEFDDPQRTTLYFSADDGHHVVTRNATWRLFDIFWMLHTMDYTGRDNFNNPVVITMGTGALWLSLSGMLLLMRSFRRRDFEFLRIPRRA